MDTNTEQNLPKQTIPNQYLPQYDVINACLEAGIKQSDIAKGIGKSRATITYAKKQLKQKYDLTDNKTLSLAYKANRMILAAVVEPDKKDKTGELVNKPLPFDIKGSDVNACIDRSFDRYQPINKDIGKPAALQVTATNFVININQDEIAKYIDVTPEPVK